MRRSGARNFEFDIDTGVGSLLPERGKTVDFASYKKAVKEAGFGLLWLEAELRGKLARAPDPSGETRPVLTVNDSGQRLFLLEGKTDEEHKAYGLLMEWIDVPKREVDVRGRVHPHTDGSSAMTVRKFHVKGGSPLP